MGERASKPRYEHIDLRDSYFDWGFYDGGYYWEDQVQPRRILGEVIDRSTELLDKLVDKIAEGYGGPKKDIEKLREVIAFNSDFTIDVRKLAQESADRLGNLLSSYPRPSEGPFLLEKPGGHSYRMFNPLEKRTNLFLEFASLNPTRQAILGFANKNGLLRNEAVGLVSTDNSLSASDIKKHFRVLELMEEKEFYVRGETLGFWQAAIRRMKWTVALWESLRNNDEQTLRRFIQWSKKGNRVGYILADEEILDRYSTAAEAMAAAKNGGFPHVVDDLISDKETMRQLKLKTGDVLLPAKLVIQKRINLELDVFEIRGVRNSTRLHLWLDEDENLISSFEPRDLLTAMWLQFYFTVSGHYNFQRCAYCKKWADISNKSKAWTMHPECANKKRVREFRASQKAPAKKPAAKKPTKKATAKKKGGAK